jgi:hypothetical protein
MGAGFGHGRLCTLRRIDLFVDPFFDGTLLVSFSPVLCQINECVIAEHMSPPYYSPYFYRWLQGAFCLACAQVFSHPAVALPPEDQTRDQLKYAGFGRALIPVRRFHCVLRHPPLLAGVVCVRLPVVIIQPAF